MRLLRRFLHGLAALVRGRRADADLDDELQQFVDDATAANVGAGMTAGQARRSALAALGSQAAVKDRVRDAGWEAHLGTWMQDLRYGVRVLRRTPLVTGAARVSLALGIGANTAVFSLINALTIRMLPVNHPEELRVLGMRTPSDADANPTFTNVLWEQI